ncbi:MAG: PIG-L deacetylase family protein [Syntrophobacteraceae bacterium]
MFKFKFQIPVDGKLNILCMGAHSDDIEIGCGGTILRLLREYPDASVHWVVFGADDTRTMEARKSADLFLEKAKHKTVVVKNYRDGFFPYIGADIKDYFELLKREVNPNIIFTHYRYDLHQDHRLICELTWNTFRDHLILEYEIMKYDGDLGNPNYFVHLNEETCATKLEYIKKCFTTQLNRSWFADDAFYALLRLRGIESCASDKYSEAFYCRKIIV